MMKQTRQLKLWNGRATRLRRHGDPLWEDVSYNGSVHGYVAAYSRADAARVICEYLGRDTPLDAELRDYWSGCWGVHMDGVTPERGLWLQFRNQDKPIRVV